jgi:hypothetical protein
MREPQYVIHANDRTDLTGNGCSGVGPGGCRFECSNSLAAVRQRRKKVILYDLQLNFVEASERRRSMLGLLGLL